MKKNRVVLVFLLTFLLSVSSMGSLSYALSSETPMASPETSEETETATENTESGEANELPNTAAPEETESEPQLSAEAISAQSESTALVDEASDTIEYVYVDERLIELGEENHIAVGLLDDGASIVSAELFFQRTDTAEIGTLALSSSFENAALFSFTFIEESDMAAYAIIGFRYSVAGSNALREVTFGSEGNFQYSFEVISAGLQEALLSEETTGEASAFVIADSGELVEANSVEEALQTAEEDTTLATDADNAAGDSIESLAAPLVPATATTAREDYLVVALDPGHGGSDPGATSYVQEAGANWQIALSMQSELRTYAGVSVFLTHNQNENPGLQQRVNQAVSGGADVFISLHNNAGGGTGSEVWVPNDSGYLIDTTHTVGSALGSRILQQLAGLGLTNRGVKVRDATNGETYPDGSRSDYFTVINASRRAGIPGIIVEHAFVDTPADAAKLADSAFLAQVGRADAAGVAQYYNLKKDSEARAAAYLEYSVHLPYIGWTPSVYDNKKAGYSQDGFSVEAINIKVVKNPSNIAGSIQAQANVIGMGWQGWKSSGESIGTTGASKSIQAVQLRLTGALAGSYDIFYRTKVAGYDWLGWAKNGVSSGSIGIGHALEGIQVTFVLKNSSAPGATVLPCIDVGQTVLEYRSHSAYIGWQTSAIANTASFAGTTGQSSCIEALTMSFSSQEYSGGIEYNSHLAYIGWQGWKSNGVVSGTTGQTRQAEAIQIRLTGELAQYYDIYYRVHSAYFGWLDWAKNGAPAGTAGYSYRMEALQIQLVSKTGGTPPSNTSNPYRQSSSAGAAPEPVPVTSLSYQAHVAYGGWLQSVGEGAIAGTSGRSWAMEALRLILSSTKHSGALEANAHLAYVGWQGWKPSGALVGTTGQSLQMEAIQIRLTGELAAHYDIFYRVHVQNMGWLGWASNGAPAGTATYGYRIEAIQIELIAKGGAAPGNTNNSYKGPAIQVLGTAPIMGTSQTTVAQMVSYFNASGSTYPSDVYMQYGAPTVESWCTVLLEEAKKEGVRAEVVIAQAMKETGWFRFGGQVQVGQCNFAGLGATNGGATGADFSTYGINGVRIGLRAQIQHLKGYATTIPASSFASDIVSPRFPILEQMGYRGKAPTLAGLNGRWAVPGTTYGQDIEKMMNTLFSYAK